MITSGYWTAVLPERHWTRKIFLDFVFQWSPKERSVQVLCTNTRGSLLTVIPDRIRAKCTLCTTEINNSSSHSSRVPPCKLQRSKATRFAIININWGEVNVKYIHFHPYEVFVFMIEMWIYKHQFWVLQMRPSVILRELWATIQHEGVRENAEWCF